MWLHISAVVVVLGCILQAYLFYRTRRLLNIKEGTPSASHNTGSSKLPLDIDKIDREICNLRGWGFDTDELIMMQQFIIPIIERQLRASA